MRPGGPRGARLPSYVTVAVAVPVAAAGSMSRVYTPATGRVTLAP
ncbi:hypothetical protein PT931_29040 [Longispora urticae]